jgi:hypothetical protein
VSNCFPVYFPLLTVSLLQGQPGVCAADGKFSDFTSRRGLTSVFTVQMVFVQSWSGCWEVCCQFPSPKKKQKPVFSFPDIQSQTVALGVSAQQQQQQREQQRQVDDDRGNDSGAVILHEIGVITSDDACAAAGFDERRGERLQEEPYCSTGKKDNHHLSAESNYAFDRPLVPLAGALRPDGLLPPLGGGSGLLVGQSETSVQEVRRREQVKQKKQCEKTV